MADLINALYSSFSSAQDQQGGYDQMQLLKVVAPKYDLERFEKELGRIQRHVGLRIQVKAIHPSRRNEGRLRKQEKENSDFLDYIFSDTIPFFHEFLNYGNPETQFYQVKGRKGDIDVFNKLCLRMVYRKELQCKLEVTDRRKLPKRNQLEDAIFGNAKSEPDFLDAIFTDDLSSCNPFMHNMLTTVY
mmetsp:Transcript_11444/g.28934  ORF Transcript_11444/g.28934 Transcript_11444/m.28934 type:complete len:188 (+) Transcript_11444:116-679(+)